MEFTLAELECIVFYFPAHWSIFFFLKDLSYLFQGDGEVFLFLRHSFLGQKNPA